LEVSGGTYYRTYDPVDFNGNVSLAADGGPTGEADPATVSSFRLDKYLVTVGRFQQFVNAWNGGAGWLPPAGSGKHTHLNNGNGLATTGGGYEPGWIVTDDSNVEPTAGNMFLCSPTATTSAGSQENLPLNCVNWYESYAFCIWDGGFLPSDAELEYAAAGGSQQREYAWGSMDPGTASQYAIYNCYYSAGCVGGYSLATIAPVGHASLGAGLWGQLDLAGEVEAWALDSNAPYVNPCNDCAHLGAASSRVVRGGSFIWGSQELLVAFRDTGPPSLRNVVQGFRCARSP
jgi:formylglycine-generating enzyme required for sulfatase activity